jgi:hypothetical protein
MSGYSQLSCPLPTANRKIKAANSKRGRKHLPRCFATGSASIRVRVQRLDGMGTADFKHPSDMTHLLLGVIFVSKAICGWCSKEAQRDSECQVRGSHRTGAVTFRVGNSDFDAIPVEACLETKPPW